MALSLKTVREKLQLLFKNEELVLRLCHAQNGCYWFQCNNVTRLLLVPT